MKMIGVMGSRKYQDKKSVIELVNSIPHDAVVITAGCAGVCAWVRETARALGLQTIVFAPDLAGIRSPFDAAERYYRRNREMVQACDTIHIFISKEEGLGGGTRFELTYALRIKKPVTVHWEGFVTGTAHMGGDFGGEPSPDAWKEFFYNTVTARG